MRFSGIERLPNFALLGPGFTEGQMTLLTELSVTRENPLLVYAPFECPGSSPMIFSAGGSMKVEFEFEEMSRPPTISLRDDHYREHIAQIREAIGRGDVYQVCYTVKADVASIAGNELASLLCRNGVPRFFAWVRLPNGEEFISASPELFFETKGRHVHAEPMKGTARSKDVTALEVSEKDRAELAMITDLLRNDLTPVCKPRTVQVTCERRTISLPYAIQTVSDITGELFDEITPLDVFAALHPGGSVTGAPKQAALEQIRKLESTPRGAYCGAIGVIPGDRSVFSLLIRTAAKNADGWTYGVGSGVVYDSDADTEHRELLVKLGALGDPRYS